MKCIVIKKNINKDSINYHFVKPDEHKLTYADFIDLLKNSDKDFLKEFKKTLISAGEILNSAYKWECPSVSQNTKNQPFEFAVIKSSSLNTTKWDYAAFQKHIDKSIDGENNDVCSFLNLGKDAKLVVPIPREIKDYRNLAEFAKSSSIRQWQAFWQEVAKCLERSLDGNDSPKWLSTCGTGVSYLHVRIDRNPKYYSYGRYKDLKYRTEENSEFGNIKQWAELEQNLQSKQQVQTEQSAKTLTIFAALIIVSGISLLFWWLIKKPR